jgi:hypothetical protein
MGFFIAYDKIYLAESSGRITSLLDIDEIDFPCTIINNEVNSYDELKQVLINENISRLFEYQRTMGHKPVLEIATTNKRSRFTISFYDQVIYEEFEDGTIAVANNLNKTVREILNSTDTIFTKYQTLLGMLPIKTIGKYIFRLGRNENLNRSMNGMIYRCGDAFYLVGSRLTDFFDEAVITQLLLKNQLNYIDDGIFKSKTASVYTTISFMDFLRKLNSSIYLTNREKIELNGDQIIYGNNKLSIKQSQTNNKWFIAGPFDLILNMFGAETRAELDEYISKQIGKKRRNGVFPNCDSRDEIIKLIESLRDE